jgi:hypothetical protein
MHDAQRIGSDSARLLGTSGALSSVCRTYCGSSETSAPADEPPAPPTLLPSSSRGSGTASRAETRVSAPGSTKSESNIERIVDVPKLAAGGGGAPVIARSRRCSLTSCLYCRSVGCFCIDSPVTSLKK